MHKWIENLKKWIDEEETPQPAEAPRRSKWEDFLVKVAREVEQAMLGEMFTPPGGPTYIPREYVVFLSPDDDAEWQGEKREGLERGLRYVLSERAKELVGERELQTRSITIELRVDGTLEAGRFRVQHIWDADAQRTMVKPRRREAPKPEPDDEATVVRPRPAAAPLFTVQVRRTAGATEEPPTLREFYKNEITLGRGSSQTVVDLRLEGDLEVSRKHATLSKRADGSFTLTCHGANPILIEGRREVCVGESVEVKPGERIGICGFEVVLQSVTSRDT